MLSLELPSALFVVVDSCVVTAPVLGSGAEVVDVVSEDEPSLLVIVVVVSDEPSLLVVVSDDVLEVLPSSFVVVTTDVSVVEPS